MIKYIENSHLFSSKADALVNPVNCRGVMGKGIALEFKRRFPECVQPYKEACAAGKLIPGILLYVRLTVQPDFFGVKRPGVILFPTKNLWRDKSRIEWIDQGLVYLKDSYTKLGLKSIAMPQIGCGLGGLEWEDVKPIIEKYFSEDPLEVEVYLKAVYDYREKIPQIHPEKYYFAYGSNMDVTQMKSRCPKAVPYGNAKLPGHRFIINSRGVATVVPDTSKDVRGVLWVITSDCEQSLDSYEGLVWGTYKRLMVDIEISPEIRAQAIIYAASDSSIGSPMDNYMEKIVAAAEHHGLEKEYVTELRSWLKTKS